MYKEKYLQAYLQHTPICKIATQENKRRRDLANITIYIICLYL